MQIPLRINVHGMETAPAVEALVRDRVTKLEKCFDQAVARRAAIEARARRAHRRARSQRSASAASRRECGATSRHRLDPPQARTPPMP